MSLNRYDAKRDANEPDIVAALLADGLNVMRLNKPTDLLVWRMNGRGFVFIEIKDGKGKPTDFQVTFFERTLGMARGIARNAQEALALARQWA